MRSRPGCEIVTQDENAHQPKPALLTVDRSHDIKHSSEMSIFDLRRVLDEISR